MLIHFYISQMKFSTTMFNSISWRRMAQRYVALCDQPLEEIRIWNIGSAGAPATCYIITIHVEKTMFQQCKQWLCWTPCGCYSCLSFFIFILGRVICCFQRVLGPISSLDVRNCGLKDQNHGPINKKSVGSDNGLAPIRRQATIWTNDGQMI